MPYLKRESLQGKEAGWMRRVEEGGERGAGGEGGKRAKHISWYVV
jgi:hypothetical protein